MLPPDHRALKIIEQARSQDEYVGDDVIERDFFYLVKGKGSTLLDVQIAYEIYLTEEDRHAFNALLIGRAESQLVAEALRCPSSILMPYKHLFFDVSSFRHTPAMYRYVRELEIDDEENPEWRQYYTVSMQQGPEYLANRFRVGERPDVEPRKVLRTAVSDMYDRFLVHRGKALDSSLAKEALRWGNAAVSTSLILIEKGGDTKKNAMEEFKVILETQDHTSTPEEAQIDVSEVLTG